jgi:pilus assembly protein CpaE
MKTDGLADNGWTALIVEPSSEVQSSMARQLEAHGFRVAAAMERAEQIAAEAQAHTPDLLVLPLGENGDSAIDNIEQLASELNTRVIVTAQQAEADLILRVLRAGASEFLVQPVSSDEFGAAVERVVRSLTPQQQAPGQVFAIYSPKGGLGSTTVAVNLACTLARKHPNERVAVVDAVMHGGDINVFLDMNPRYTIADLLGKKDRIDTQLLEKVMAQHSTGVWVLAEPGHATDASTVSGDNMIQLVSRMRRAFDFVLIDCEHQLTSRTLGILESADKILLLTTLSVPAVRQLQRVLDTFTQIGIADAKTYLVVNRHQTSDVLQVRDVEKTFKRPVVWRLPNDYKAADDAITRGRPFAAAAPRTKLSQSYERLAVSLNSGETTGKRPHLASRMRRMLLKSKRQ